MERRFQEPDSETSFAMMSDLPERFIFVWLGVPMAFALLASAWPRGPRAFNRLVTGCLMGLHRRPWMIALPVVASGLVVLWAHHGFPQPRIHDEFSYLLAADTYAHGRLANPPHPLWESFETFHVNSQPFYVSMYQPGIGMVLAAGQQLLGHPWFAVWLSAIGLPLVVHWAARGWVPPPWAAAAGLVTAVIVSRGYWLDSYWGGALPAIGGGLVMGAWPRIRRVAGNDVASMIGATLPLAGGGLLLLFTRPYEGLALILPVAAGLGASRMAARSHGAWIGTCIVALGIGLTWLAFYDWKTTGNALMTPYSLNLDAYHDRKLFVLGADRESPPVYRHDVMRRMYSEEFQLRPFSAEAIRKYIVPTISFYGAPLHLITLASLPWLFRNRRILPLLLATGCVCIAALLTVFVRPHYLAPAAAGIVILTVQGFRVVSTLRWRGHRIGRTVAFGFLVCWLVVAYGYGVVKQMSTVNPPAWVRERTRIAEELGRMGGRHLVLVRYASGHRPHDEWVYNGADLGPDARILWARTMDKQSDAQLMQHETGRTAWLIEPDTTFELRRLTP